MTIEHFSRATQLTQLRAAGGDGLEGAASGDGARDSHDALERALLACLAAFVQVASESGQVGRALRVREALDVLRDRPRAPRAAAPTRVGPAAMELARAQPRLYSLPGPAARPARHSLTARQLEVVGLIAQGLTNRQIADKLVISERTADTHVQNIIGKLGVVCRAQVAMWFVEHPELALEVSQSRGQVDVI